MRAVLLMGLWISGIVAHAASLQDVPFTFDESKVHAATDVYEFTTSFADYYYALLNANRKTLSTLRNLQNEEVWCAGDAHPKNFGALILQDEDSIFTLNDMDDAGPCPAVMDLLRFLLTAHLAESKVLPKDLVESYGEGVLGKPISAPKMVNTLLNRSRQAGMQADPDGLIKGSPRLKRDGKAREVTVAERAELTALFHSLTPNWSVLDIYAREKVGGGSGGILRYEVLINGGSGLLHLELKGQPGPATAVVASSPVPPAEERIRRTVELEMGPQASPLYQVVKVSGQEMLLRPRFLGNMPVKLSAGDKKTWLKYEAYILGQLHARTLVNPTRWAAALAREAWGRDVQVLKSHFRQKFDDVSQME